MSDLGDTQLQIRPTAAAELLVSSDSFFPRSHELIITTTDKVYSWTRNCVTEIFSSRSGGIVAAKKTRNGRELLAIADSQILVLHDIKQGMKQSYRLKGTEVGTILLSLSSREMLILFSRAAYVFSSMPKRANASTLPRVCRMLFKPILSIQQNFSTRYIHIHLPLKYLRYLRIWNYFFLPLRIHPLST